MRARPASAVSLPAGPRSRVLVAVAVAGVAVGVWLAQSTLGWSGDPVQLAIIGSFSLVATGTSAAFFLRRRRLPPGEGAWLGPAWAALAAACVVQLGSEWAGGEEVLAAVDAALWPIANLGTAIALGLTAGVARSRRELGRGSGAVAAGIVVAGVVGLMASSGLAVNVEPIRLGLMTTFLISAVGPLTSARQRWLETGCGASCLLLAVVNGNLAWSTAPLDDRFMWAHVFVPVAALLPVLGAARDDSERLQSLTTLSDHIVSRRRRTEVLLDTLPVLVLSVDRDQRLRYANRIARQLLGIGDHASGWGTRAEWLDRIHRPDRERLQTAVSIIGDGSSRQWEAVLRAVDGDGGVHWLNTQLHRVTDPETGDELVEIVASDVTDLFLARRTAEVRQTRMTFLSNVAQTVAGETADQRILERFLELGQEMYPMVSLLLYRPVANGSGLRLDAATGPATESFDEHRRQPLGPGHPCGLTFRDGFPRTAPLTETLPAPVAERIRDGHDISHVLYLPLLAAGRVVGVLATTTTSEPALDGEEIDLLTQVGFLLGGAVYLTQLVQELDQQRAVAMEASRLKSEFLANTSHELRTPLTAILGFLRLVIDGAVAEPDKQREFLKIAHESAGKLLTIINDVLDLAKIEAGRLEVELAPVPARRVLHDVETLFRHQMKSQGLGFTVAPAASTLILWTDPDRTVQILTNLLSNAMKFTQRGGSISVDCSTVDDVVTFAITDTGTGISSDELERVFDSFYQIDGSTTRQHGGTGLGLTISRRLAELMGGRLTLDSAGQGLGTTARLRLRRYLADRHQTTEY